MSDWSSDVCASDLPHDAAIEKPLAAVVVDQQFAHGFLRAIRTLRHWAHGVGHFRGKIAAEYGHRTAEHHARATAKRTRALQNLPGGIEIDFHALVEIGFGVAADDGRQLKNALHVGVSPSMASGGTRDAAANGFVGGVGAAAG